MAKYFDCLGRTPFASLLAALMVVIGTCVFCGTSFKALQLMIQGVFNNLFHFSVDWLEVLQVMFVIVGVVMGAFAVILLIFGFLATGATRSNIYSGAKCIMGGRLTAAFLMIVSYLLTAAWLVILSVCVVPVLLYASVSAICDKEIYQHTADQLKGYCFNLTRFGVYGLETGADNICEHSDLRSMCNKVEEAGPMFCVACGAAFLVVLGMVNFLITLAANYTRIKISRELTEYRDAVEQEELEMQLAEKRGPPPYRDGSITLV
ncbi:proteolipid protein DM beta [Aplysia californica]|uniref:Proteolipid protein DM beta n=1 Tax=Aplysia californica TaxID=6500 RepID=A0ABM0JTF8_APLCA|nr:proteolipid protein DM beta [Aplysia californica]